MQAFDWPRFFASHSIEFVERGANVAKNHIAVKCPYCGDADPSQHLGINLKTGQWGCWRDPTHRGVNAAKLIAALLGCSRAEATKHLDSADQYIATMADLDAVIASLSDEPAPAGRDLRTPLPADFKQISTRLNSFYQRFVSYLSDRGFHDVDALAEEYDLRCTLRGEHAYRIIFPFYVYGETIGWTGRAITKGAAMRYRVYPPGTDTAGYVYNADGAREGGKRLYIVEGPVDTLKIDFYGKPFGARAVGVLTSSVNAKKALEIIKLAEKYERVFLLLDDDAFSQSMRACEMLASCSVPIERIQLTEAHDPGEMRRRQIERLVQG